MPELIVNYPNRPPEKVQVTRLRTTIGRSARSDVCIPDGFASRLHAEIRKEGDAYWLQDLGSANGTRYNSANVTLPIPLISGGEIHIGETIIIFQDNKQKSLPNATLIADNTEALNPALTISLTRNQNATSELISQQSVSSRSELLGLIGKVGVTLLNSTGLDDTLNQVATLVFDAVPADRCVIMLRDEKSERDMKIAVARIRGKEDSIDEVRISRTVLDEVLKNGKSVLTSDAQHDPRFATQTFVLSGIRSVLAVPLSVHAESVFGLIYADSPTAQITFNEEHLNILTTLASVASIRVENARLLEERFERNRMEHELQLASEIQQRFQPSTMPSVSGYDFQGISFSCYEIGGDYYDFIPRPDNRMFVALGDVSGKGTAAALLMSSLHAAIHAQVSANSTLEQTIISVNKYLSDNTPSNRFVTLFLGELDCNSGTLSYINAGHNPPLVARTDGTTEQLESGGFPLGIIKMAEYEKGEITLSDGEALIVYSDGVSEANNLKGDEFGVERLRAVICQNLYRSASGLRDKVESALSEFTQTAPVGDDITLVIVKKTTPTV